MALYLGGQRVTPSLNTIIEKKITITQDTNGNTISTSETQTPGTSNTFEDPDNLSKDLPVVREPLWDRPTGWPDLDALPALTEGVYLTYDNRSTVDFKYACFYCDVQSSGQYTVTRGHMNGGTFVQDQVYTAANTATYTQIDYSVDTTNNFIVFKITPTTASKHLTSMYFGRITQAAVGTLAVRPQYDQYCLERKGWLPYLSSTAGSGDNIRFCTQWMEHDNVEFGNTVTSLAAAWYRGKNLKKIEWGNWTGANCNITSLGSTFSNCQSIEKIDLSLWNIDNWHLTTIDNLFANCYNMKICIVPFNTINWGSGTGKTFSMYNTWLNCLALEELDLSMWDMSNLNVTTIYACWAGCFHLKSLNIKNWNTSKWTISGTNGLYCLFQNCRMLVDIDLSGWNTSNWIPNRADNMFQNNCKRRNFNDIKNWNTSNWKIVQFNDAFNGCHKIQELDLRNWNTSSWKVSTLSATFGNLYSVRTIDVTGWDTSQWVVTNLNYVFYYDYNLEEIKGFWNWDVSNWPVTNGGYQMFDTCYRLKEVDFSHWTTTKFAFAADGKCDIRYMFRNNYNIKKIDLSTFNINAINSLNYYAQNAAGSRSYSPFYCCYNLEKLILPQHYKGHIDLSDMYKIARDDLVSVLTSLDPAMISGDNHAKVWIINSKYKLTSADIAIATNKDYTVVQS